MICAIRERKTESKLEGKMRREKGKGKMKTNWKWSVERKGESSINPYRTNVENRVSS